MVIPSYCCHDPDEVFDILKSIRVMRYNNNPANIRFDNRNKWQGLIGEKNGFCEFSDISFGIRALIVLLKRYIKSYKLTDVEKIISRFAPPSENNTRAYIRYVSNYLSSRGFQSVDIEYNSSAFHSLVCAICWYETNFPMNRMRVRDIIQMYNLK